MNVRASQRGLALLGCVLAGVLLAGCGRKETGTPPGGQASPGPTSQGGNAPTVDKPTDVDWVLIRLGDESVGPNGRKTIQLRLASGDKVAQGQAVCNTFRARFELDQAGLRFGPLDVTRKACPGINVEKRYLEAIQATSRYAIEADRLTLSDASGKPLAEFAQRAGD